MDSQDAGCPCLDGTRRRIRQAGLPTETGRVTRHLSQRRVGPVGAVKQVPDFGDEIFEGCVQRHRAIIDEDRHQHGRERFRDRAGPVDGLTRRGHLALGIGPPVCARPQHLTVTGKRRGDRRHAVVLHIGGDLRAELFDSRCHPPDSWTRSGPVHAATVASKTNTAPAHRRAAHVDASSLYMFTRVLHSG